MDATGPERRVGCSLAILALGMAVSASVRSNSEVIETSRQG